LEKLFKKVLN